MMSRFRQNVVVIGMPVGGLSVLMALVKQLPHLMRAMLFVACYISSQSRKTFIEILSNFSWTWLRWPSMKCP